MGSASCLKKKNACSVLLPKPPHFPGRREAAFAMGKVCCYAEKLAESVLSTDGVSMGASSCYSRGGCLQPGTVPKPPSLIMSKAAC